MKDAWRLYLHYVGISMRGQMQYRASFIMLVVGFFLTTVVEFLGIWALFGRFGSLRGWSLAEVAMFYGVTHLAFAFAEIFGRGFDTFPNLVKTGDFDRLLLRPRSTVLQVIGGEISLMRIGRILQALPILLWAVHATGMTWSVGKALLLLGAIAGGAALFMGLFIMQAALSFWTIESLEIANILTHGGTETGQYPLDIYRVWFRTFFTFVVPLACANVLPLNVILQRPHALPVVGALSPLLGLIFLALALLAWRQGVRHYHSTGS
jgi:ABC-2 type transport system permease protein